MQNRIRIEGGNGRHIQTLGFHTNTYSMKKNIIRLTPPDVTLIANQNNYNFMPVA